MSKLSDRFEKETGLSLYLETDKPTKETLLNYVIRNLKYIEWLEKLAEKEIVYPSQETIDMLDSDIDVWNYYDGIDWAINEIKELNK
jgi:hypothetical protein